MFGPRDLDDDDRYEIDDLDDLAAGPDDDDEDDEDTVVNPDDERDECDICGGDHSTALCPED